MGGSRNRIEVPRVKGEPQLAEAMAFRKIPRRRQKLPEHRASAVMPKTIRGMHRRTAEDAPSFGFTRRDPSRSEPRVGQGSQNSRNNHRFLFAEKLKEGVETKLRNKKIIGSRELMSTTKFAQPRQNH